MSNFDKTWLVARRELVDQLRDWRILMPMIILTIFFPYLMNVAAKTTVSYVNQYGANMMAERMLPFLILVVGYFPVTVSLVVALEAFVGEKERGTIEPLLSSPLADEHLYLGKLLAGTIVPLTVSYLGIGLYMAGLTWQGIHWPSWNFISQTLALTAVQTLLMVSAAIVISTQSTTVRAANLLASFIVIPIGLLIQGESALMFWGTNDVLWLAVIGVIVMSGLIIRLGIIHFRRENLLGREIDMLSPSWVWTTFRNELVGSDQPIWLMRYFHAGWKKVRKQEAESISFAGAIQQDLLGLVNWYRNNVFPTLKSLLPAFLCALVISLIAIFVAYFYVDANLPHVVLSQDGLREALKSIRDYLIPDGSEKLSTSMLFWHNLRAELVILVLGIFSFGVLSILALIGNMALIGAVLGTVRLVGLSPAAVFLTGIMPHGIIELTSIILISSAVFQMGLRLVTPMHNQSIGTTVIITFAQVIKVFIAVCIPMLLIAALIEANITPRILLAFIGQTLNLKP